MTFSYDLVSYLNREDLARFIMDMFHRIIILHGLWFNEAARQFGMPKTLDTLFHPPLQKGERGGFEHKKEAGKGSPPLLFRLPAPSQATRLAGVRAS
jgi:hypothetical protein